MVPKFYHSNHIGRLISSKISIRGAIKQGSVISPIIFNVGLRSPTTILHRLVTDGLYSRHISYSDNLLLSGENLSGLQEAMTSICSSLNSTGLTVTPCKIKFLIFGINQQIRVLLSINVDGTVVTEKKS